MGRGREHSRPADGESNVTGMLYSKTQEAGHILIGSLDIRSAKSEYSYLCRGAL
jgi:hypothetical protein